MAGLLAVPAIEGDIALERIEVNCKLADPQLEAMSEAQKHLFRMGPENIYKVHAKLRELGRALGIARTLENVRPIAPTPAAGP
jgi:hypothetical protein